MYVCAVYSLQTINYQPTNCLDQDAVALSSAALAQALGVGCIGATLRFQNIGILRLWGLGFRGLSTRPAEILQGGFEFPVSSHKRRSGFQEDRRRFRVEGLE